jgi:hypothetical protein
LGKDTFDNLQDKNWTNFIPLNVIAILSQWSSGLPKTYLDNWFGEDCWVIQ